MAVLLQPATHACIPSRQHIVKLLKKIEIYRDGLERITVPDTATVAQLKAEINRVLSIPAEDMALSKDPKLVQTSHDYDPNSTNELGRMHLFRLCLVAVSHVYHKMSAVRIEHSAPEYNTGVCDLGSYVHNLQPNGILHTLHGKESSTLL